MGRARDQMMEDFRCYAKHGLYLVCSRVPLRGFDQD